MDSHVSYVTPQSDLWMENKKPFEFPTQEDHYFFPFTFISIKLRFFNKYMDHSYPNPWKPAQYDKWI